MSKLEVLCFPDDRLRTVAKPIEHFDENLQTLIDDMFETMYQDEGIGLAATQVDQHVRLIVMDIEGDKTNQLVFINPEIVESNGETGIEEGCLSVPDYRALVPRKEFVTIKALNRHGEEFTLEADELLAICIQHEMDHLNGVLFVDYLSPLKRQRVQRKLEKYKKALEKQKL